MKTTIKNSLVIIAMLGVITSYANLNPSEGKTNNIKATVLTLENVDEGQQLLIKSVNGTILYKEEIKKEGYYQKEFDLTSLPNGNYFFELEKDMEIQIIPFNVSSTNVKFAKENEVKIFKPLVKSKNNKLYFSKLSLDQKPVMVEIYYNNANSYESIFSEKIENTQVIERIYSLDKEKSGTYKVITKSDGRVYTQVFTI